MFCPNCGTNLVGNEDFCANCGTDLRKIREQSDIINNKLLNGTTMIEKLSKKTNNFMKTKIQHAKDFFIKHNKMVFTTTGVIVIGITSFIIFNNFHDFTKLSWDIETGDANVTITCTFE